MLSSGQHCTYEPTTAMVPTQDLCKIKSVEKLQCGLGRTPKTPSTAEKLWAVDDC